MHRLNQPPVLCYPDFSKPFIIRSDASKQGLGAILCQEQESGDVRVVSYGSRTMQKAEENYSTHKLEFLALYWAATKQFHHYLYGAPHFTVTTDHNPLTYVQTSGKLDAVGYRWMAELGTYNFDVSYKPERLNNDVDALLLCPLQVSCSSVQALLTQGRSMWIAWPFTLIRRLEALVCLLCHWMWSGPKNRGKILFLPQFVVWWEGDKSQLRSRGPSVTLRCLSSWMSGQGWSLIRMISTGKESTPMERRTGNCFVLNSYATWCANYFMMIWDISDRTGP